MKPTWKEKINSFCRGWVGSILIALLIATSFKSAIADWNDVPTGSMIPTILIGDRIFINKLAYDLKLPYTTVHLAQWGDPRRGDIVVFYSPEDGKRLVKRVVGLPGDTIAMHRNRVLINGEFLSYKPLDSDFTRQVEDKLKGNRLFFEEKLDDRGHPVMISPDAPSLNSFQPLVIPEGNYFMMGDNRDNSADSRFFGFVDRNRIVGRATAVAVSRDGSFLHPRWQRFFKKLS